VSECPAGGCESGREAEPCLDPPGERAGSPRIALIGAGIGGLVAAIALLQAGFDVQVFEQAAVLGEVGAGFTLSRGAQRVLEALGLQEAIRARATHTARMAFLHYRSGAVLGGGIDRGDGTDMPEHPVGMHIHRADLHAILVAEIDRLAPAALVTGHRLVDLKQGGAGVTAVFANGVRMRTDAVIGTDGVRSRVRQVLWGEGAPRFTGQLAYRCLIPAAAAAPYLSAGRAAVFMGPGRVFSRYTLRRNSLLNCVGIVQTGEWLDDGWSIPATAAEMQSMYEGWHSDVPNLIGLAPAAGLLKWGIFDRPALPRWRQGRVTLLGDAAHPMLPFLGLGAAMAIEDGLILARAVMGGGSIEDGFDRYEAARRPRTIEVADLSRRQGELNQAQSPDSYDHEAAPAGNRAVFDFDPIAEGQGQSPWPSSLGSNPT
jgi:salicylate hydroxylase